MEGRSFTRALPLVATWLPIIAVVILLGWAFSWRPILIGYIAYVALMVAISLYARRLRRKRASHPADDRTYAERSNKLLERLGMSFGFLIVTFFLAMLVLLIVEAATGGQG